MPVGRERNRILYSLGESRPTAHQNGEGVANVRDIASYPLDIERSIETRSVRDCELAVVQWRRKITISLSLGSTMLKAPACDPFVMVPTSAACRKPKVFRTSNLRHNACGVPYVLDAAHLSDAGLPEMLSQGGPFSGGRFKVTRLFQIGELSKASNASDSFSSRKPGWL